MTVPEEAVVGVLPKGCCMDGWVSLKTVCKVVRVWKVEWIVVEMMSYQFDETRFIGVLKRQFQFLLGVPESRCLCQVAGERFQTLSTAKFHERLDGQHSLCQTPKWHMCPNEVWLSRSVHILFVVEETTTSSGLFVSFLCVRFCHVLCKLIFAEALSMTRPAPDVVAAKARTSSDW